MTETRVLLIFPGSLYGGRWAAGPRVKPELVILSSELRREGVAVDVLDLEVECGNPGDDGARAAFLARADELLAAQPADLVVVSCWSALQYTAAVAIAERVRRLHPGAVIAAEGYRVRRLHPGAVIAAEGYHVSVRPDDFTEAGAPFDWLIVGEAESAAVTVAAAVAGGERETGVCRALEGRPLPLDAEHAPDYAAYPYAGRDLPELGVFLSRGCPYNAPACLLRPGGGGWHAYPPHVAVAILTGLSELSPARIDVLDPAFGYDPVWRHAVLEGLASADRRDLAITVAGRPADLTRGDIDRLYEARVRLRLDVGTLSRELLSRTGQAPQPARAIEHALDLLTYANAKGLVTVASLTFNQPGETRASAAETLEALQGFVEAAPNTSVFLQAQAWAFLPAGDPAADLETPAARFGTRIARPQWWKERVPAEAAAKEVVASRDLADLAAGDESYWRPRFDELHARLDAKLTNEARRGLRSHETVGSAAAGVPHGWWVEARWH
ncbi:MAG: hypothetical protein NTW58_08155 [Actinobacteria bacterium]|nr:hypothetical protein [Actinomycetota bacterium]